MYKIGIIGGGAAGMMAAAAAAEEAPDAQVILFERNEKLGRKLYITGKGRCNLTNICSTQESFSKIMRNPKFLCSAIYGFDHDAVMCFFEESGVRLKTERGGRVFPVSDHASDITSALEKRMRRAGVEIRLRSPVTQVMISGSGMDAAAERCSDPADETVRVSGGSSGHRVCGIGTEDGVRERFDAVIIATGGISYPQTGSSGDGYRFARRSGHAVEACRPSLVPMEAQEEWCAQLQGLSLRNVKVSLYEDDAAGRLIAEEFGEMLFTHYGVSGPVILSLSAVPTQRQMDAGLYLQIDLKPALAPEQLDRRLLRDLEKYGSRDMHNAMHDLLPQRLIPVILSQAGILPDQKAHTLTRLQRRSLTAALKSLQIHIRGFRDYNEAVITRGGVSVKDINASTMESKRVQGLYFAGEVIDVDALTGGYNLQIAWSTGHLAGISAAAGCLKKG